MEKINELIKLKKVSPNMEITFCSNINCHLNKCEGKVSQNLITLSSETQGESDSLTSWHNLQRKRPIFYTVYRRYRLALNSGISIYLCKECWGKIMQYPPE